MAFSSKPFLVCVLSVAIVTAIFIMLQDASGFKSMERKPPYLPYTAKKEATNQKSVESTEEKEKEKEEEQAENITSFRSVEKAKAAKDTSEGKGPSKPQSQEGQNKKVREKCKCIIVDDEHLQSSCVHGGRTNKTVHIIQMGRTGNQLCRLVSAYALARDTGSKLATDTNHLKDFLENCPYEVKPHPKNIKRVSAKFGIRHFIRAFDIALNESVLLTHWLVRYLYFGGCVQEIREKFAIKRKLLQKADEAIDSIVKNHFLALHKNDSSFGKSSEGEPCLRNGTNISDCFKVTTVGIQIRRGDITSDIYKNFGYRLPNRSYFINAMSYFQNKYDNVVFIIATNGQSWAEENLVGGEVYLSPFKSAFEDLALMSRCDHAITSIGTYSFWAGFYNLGTVIYYKDPYFPNSTLYKAMEFSLTEFYPPYWIPLL